MRARKIIERAKVDAAVEQMLTHTCPNKDCGIRLAPENLCPVCQFTELMDRRHHIETLAGDERGRCNGFYKNGKPCRSYSYAEGCCRQHWTTPEMEAHSQRNEEKAKDIATQMNKKAQDLRDQDRFHRGFAIRRLSHSKDDWQVTAVTPEAARAYTKATGETHFGGVPLDCGIYQMPQDDIIAQIDDVMAGQPPVETVIDDPETAAIIVSPATGQIYGQVSKTEADARREHELRIEEERTRRAEARARSDEATAEKQRIQAEEKQRQDHIATNRMTAMAAAAATARKQTDKQHRQEQRKRTQERHQRQDAQGLQRTDSEGRFLCDSCQRRYHSPDFAFCYNCTKGSGNREHRARIDSGEIRQRQQARQEIRDTIMAPLIAEQQAMNQTEADARTAIRQEIQAVLDANHLPWSVTSLYKWVFNGDNRQNPVRPEDKEIIETLIEDMEKSISLPAWNTFSRLIPSLRETSTRK